MYLEVKFGIYIVTLDSPVLIRPLPLFNRGSAFLKVGGNRQNRSATLQQEVLRVPPAITAMPETHPFSREHIYDMV